MTAAEVARQIGVRDAAVYSRVDSRIIKRTDVNRPGCSLPSQSNAADFVSRLGNDVAATTLTGVLRMSVLLCRRPHPVHGSP